MIVVPVPLADRPYDVIVGAGAVDTVADLLPPGPRREQVGIGVEVALAIEHRTFLIGAGEESKTLATVEDLCRQWARWGLNRADVVVAVGGGMVTDVAGFAGAVYHRGIEVIYVSTTILGQIDAAIGGKTGVNLPEGKNLVGAFWQPRAVVCDTELLATMAPRELRSGLGEMAKYHFLDDGSHGAAPLEDLSLDEQVARCVAIKAAVVADDERESGRRATLNYGHTLAHALEIAGGFDLRHGEAVAIGLVYAAELARVLGRIDDARVAEHRRVVARYDLPVDIPAGYEPAELIELFGRDKKALDGITFVLDGPDGVETVTGVDRSAMDAAFAAMMSRRPAAAPPPSAVPATDTSGADR